MKNNSMIERTHLRHVFSKERFIYICAPAGYGKTVCVRQWLEQIEKSAFITLDEYDNNTVCFCRHFCAALKSLQPENSALEKIIEHSAFDSAPDEFALRAIASLPHKGKACLVIDDLHFIFEERIIKLLLSLLKRLPENYQIVLVSRNKLPADLSDLWIKGSLCHITEEQLRFSCNEIIQLYEKRGNPVTLKQADEIHRFTGGWAIGIGAVFSSGNEPNGESLKYLDKFIQENVWNQWSEEVREFMLKTAMLRELTPALCEAVTGFPDSGRLLEKLEYRHTFISKTEQGTYRYHRLFQNFLRSMSESLGQNFCRDIPKKAGDWYLSVNDFYNAVNCFIKCESHEGIARCFMLLANAGREHFSMENLLPLINQPIVIHSAEKFPYIFGLLSWVAFTEGRTGDMAKYADMYYANQPSIVQLYPHLAHNVMFVYLIDYRNTLYELMKFAGETLQAEFQLPSAENISGVINNNSELLENKKLSVGIINQNMPLLHRGTRDFSECTAGDVEQVIMVMKSVLGGLFGDETALLAECVTAGLLYEQGHLKKAYNHAVAANSAIKEQFASEVKLCAMVILIYILDALENQKQADIIEKRISDMIEKDAAYYLNYNFKALKARRMLSRGNMDAARNWLTEQKTHLYDNLSFYKIYGFQTTCKAYITQGDYNTAVILLKKVLALSETYKRPLDIIEALTLMAIAYWKKKRGFQEEAMNYLEQAVSTAYNYGYTQVFINEGAELVGMLHRLQKRIEQKKSNSTTLSASFVKSIYIRTRACSVEGLTSGQSLQPIKFTDKQRAVMKLLCEGKSYKETAEAMQIKLPTLRSHIALIYKKLDVTNVIDAVTKIKALEIPDEE